MEWVARGFVIIIIINISNTFREKKLNPCLRITPAIMVINPTVSTLDAMSILE
jgi:hypothetical protein